MTKRTAAVAIVVGGCVALGALAASARASAPAGHFTDLGDGTVRDNLTGLTWQGGFSPSTQGQAASVTYCSTLTVPSGGGWRLPTALELRSIVDEAVTASRIDLAYFPSTPAVPFWSSSSVASAPLDGWAVGFGSGEVFDVSGAVTHRARCVR